MWDVFVKKWKMGRGCFFYKKVDLPQRRVHYVHVSILYFTFYYLGGAYLHPTHPPVYGPGWADCSIA